MSDGEWKQVRSEEPPQPASTEDGSDGLSAGLFMAVILALVCGVAMAALVFPSLLALVPIAIGITALLGLQMILYRLFGLKVRGPRDPGRPEN